MSFAFDALAFVVGRRSSKRGAFVALLFFCFFGAAFSFCASSESKRKTFPASLRVYRKKSKRSRPRAGKKARMRASGWKKERAKKKKKETGERSRSPLVFFSFLAARRSLSRSRPTVSPVSLSLSLSLQIIMRAALSHLKRPVPRTRGRGTCRGRGPWRPRG